MAKKISFDEFLCASDFLNRWWNNLGRGSNTSGDPANKNSAKKAEKIKKAYIKQQRENSR
ncbi:MAG: hypothetical protein JW812_00790 [Alphaproteobacteria bacterium]|nr:hypothetical protein [Alphaproteobacteria bacterium]MBN2779809.1 hypothetical protein [Alphaproteobacteria bacterium]